MSSRPQLDPPLSALTSLAPAALLLAPDRLAVGLSHLWALQFVRKISNKWRPKCTCRQRVSCSVQMHSAAGAHVPFVIASVTYEIRSPAPLSSRGSPQRPFRVFEQIITAHFCNKLIVPVPVAFHGKPCVAVFAPIPTKPLVFCPV